MGLFKKEPVPEQPHEFRFMAGEEWAAFNKAVRATVRRVGLAVKAFEPGSLLLENSDRLGLLNLAQMCHANDRSEWAAMIERHLRNVSDRSEEPPFATVQLRVRLYPDDYGPTGKAVVRPYAESVVAMIVVDMPTAIRSVQREELDDAGLTEDEAWSLAWRQTRERERPDEHEFADTDGVNMHFIYGESVFVASLVEFLPDLIPDLGEHGALVSIPHRHAIMAHAVRDQSVLRSLGWLIPGTRQMYAEGPGSVSAHLYWWKDGTLTWLPVSASEASIEFHPPESFVAMLSSLPLPE